jgi:hypothetical protein
LMWKDQGFSEQMVTLCACSRLYFCLGDRG